MKQKKQIQEEILKLEKEMEEKNIPYGEWQLNEEWIKLNEDLSLINKRKVKIADRINDLEKEMEEKNIPYGEWQLNKEWMKLHEELEEMGVLDEIKNEEKTEKKPFKVRKIELEKPPVEPKDIKKEIENSQDNPQKIEPKDPPFIEIDVKDPEKDNNEIKNNVAQSIQAMMDEKNNPQKTEEETKEEQKEDQKEEPKKSNWDKAKDFFKKHWKRITLGIGGALLALGITTSLAPKQQLGPGEQKNKAEVSMKDDGKKSDKQEKNENINESDKKESKKKEFNKQIKSSVIGVGACVTIKNDNEATHDSYGSEPKANLNVIDEKNYYITNTKVVNGKTMVNLSVSKDLNDKNSWIGWVDAEMVGLAEQPKKEDINENKEKTEEVTFETPDGDETFVVNTSKRNEGIDR